MALPGRVVASFQAIIPVPTLTGLDGEFNQGWGATGMFNGGGSTLRQLTKYNHATEPVLELDQLGAGLIAQFKQNGVEKARIENDGDIVGNGITGAAGIYTFGSIPLGPASDPTTSNQLTRKAYTDAKKTGWSANWFEPDPSTSTVTTEDRPMVFIPDGSTWKVTKITVRYSQGSHTSGGGLTFTVSKRGPSGNANVGSISLDNTNNTILTTYTNDFADIDLLPGDTLTYNISTRSGTITERAVTLSAWGTQTLT